MGAENYSQMASLMTHEEWQAVLATIPKPTLRERLWGRRYDRDLLKVRALIEEHEFQIDQLYEPPNGPWIDYARRTHAAVPIVCSCCGHYCSGKLRGICFDCRDRGCKDPEGVDAS